MGVIVRSSVSEYVRKRESVRNKLQKLESHTSERTNIPSDGHFCSLHRCKVYVISINSTAKDTKFFWL